MELPLSGGKCMVDAERLRNIVDDIRGNMPSEVRQAKAIVADAAISSPPPSGKPRGSSARRRSAPPDGVAGGDRPPGPAESQRDDDAGPSRNPRDAQGRERFSEDLLRRTKKRGLPSAWARCGRRASFFGILPSRKCRNSPGIIDRKKGENAEGVFPFAFISERLPYNGRERKGGRPCP